MLTISLGIGGVPSSTKREHKGKSLLESIDNYTVVDLETTGLAPSYDEIIEFAAVKVENGKIVSEFQSLVKPSEPIGEFIIDLTGITNEMLETAPRITDVLPSFLAFVGKDIVVAHNANFDINFIYDACISEDSGTVFDNDFIDTMRVSRRLFTMEWHHRLKDLVKRFGITSEVEHRSMSDALITYKCYEYMKQYAAAKSIDFKSLYPLHKGRIVSEITSNKQYFDETTLVFGKTFVFTGVLERMVRKDAMQLVVDMGGICENGVTVKTNFLVLGNNDYCKLIKDGKSNKHKKAEKYKASSLDIEIISEDVFYDMVHESYEQAG